MFTIGLWRFAIGVIKREEDDPIKFIIVLCTLILTFLALLLDGILIAEIAALIKSF